MDVAAAFINLFRGRVDAWGSVEGKSNKEPVTDEHYKLHLQGKQSLGVYPLLDDGTCNFAAIDLDEKNFDKALLIREALMSRGIHAYIAESKGKGYHIYIFGDQMISKDVRYVLRGVLRELDIIAEVFPKQDMLDETIVLGNYINLPCYGGTRPWLTTDNKAFPLENALSLIKKNTNKVFIQAKSTVPKPKPLLPQPTKKTTTSKKKKIKSPPCIIRLLKGVSEGLRDEAAFALARHFLDQDESPEEVLNHLVEWDAKNDPPLGDVKYLMTKVQSAEHGYAFGCGSITSGLLSTMCVGQQDCEFIREQIQQKKKEGLIVEASFWEDDKYIYEEVVSLGRNNKLTEAGFIRFEKETGALERVKEINTSEEVVWPVKSEEIAYGSVSLPTGIEDYIDVILLVEEIKEHIRKYADIPESFLEFAAWYVLMTWVYCRLPAMLYLRFLGDFGTGKSRSLDVIGGLCYKRMRSGGAITPAPLYRKMKKYEGTLVIDEADFGKSDETHEIVKILNAGIERGTPIERCQKDNPDNMQVFPCFGPKAFATRDRFKDDALESRCLTCIMQETDRNDIPSYLAKEHKQVQQRLRNKLLLWRFHNLRSIPEEISEETDIDLGPIEGRLKQVCIPFAMVFKDMPETMDRFKSFLRKYTQELRDNRSDSAAGRIVYALFKAAVQNGRENVTMKMIKSICSEDLNLDMRENTISRKMHNMGFKSIRHRIGLKKETYIIYDQKLWKQVYRKYLHDLQLSGSEDTDDENEEFLTKVLEIKRIL